MKFVMANLAAPEVSANVPSVVNVPASVSPNDQFQMTAAWA